MAALFQIVLFAVAVARAWFGEAGLFASAGVLGLADMDALTVSMADQVERGTAPSLAAGALVVGLFANTAVKCSIAVAVGRGRFRALAGIGLGLIGAALLAALARGYLGLFSV
jgi:uncharacterized membrane protein (DUF4010 family)